MSGLSLNPTHSPPQSHTVTLHTVTHSYTQPHTATETKQNLPGIFSDRSVVVLPIPIMCTGMEVTTPVILSISSPAIFTPNTNVVVSASDSQNSTQVLLDAMASVNGVCCSRT